MINWIPGISSTYYVSLQQTSYLPRDYGSVSDISVMDFGGIWYRQILICLCVRNILATKLHVLGLCLHLADFLFHCVPVAD